MLSYFCQIGSYHFEELFFQEFIRGVYTYFNPLKNLIARELKTLESKESSVSADIVTKLETIDMELTNPRNAIKSGLKAYSGQTTSVRLSTMKDELQVEMNRLGLKPR